MPVIGWFSGTHEASKKPGRIAATAGLVAHSQDQPVRPVLYLADEPRPQHGSVSQRYGSPIKWRYHDIPYPTTIGIAVKHWILRCEVLCFFLDKPKQMCLCHVELSYKWRRNEEEMYGFPGVVVERSAHIGPVWQPGKSSLSSLPPLPWLSSVISSQQQLRSNHFRISPAALDSTWQHLTALHPEWPGEDASWRGDCWNAQLCWRVPELSTVKWCRLCPCLCPSYPDCQKDRKVSQLPWWHVSQVPAFTSVSARHQLFNTGGTELCGILSLEQFAGNLVLSPQVISDVTHLTHVQQISSDSWFCLSCISLSSTVPTVPTVATVPRTQNSSPGKH